MDNLPSQIDLSGFQFPHSPLHPVFQLLYSYAQPIVDRLDLFSSSRRNALNYDEMLCWIAQRPCGQSSALSRLFCS